jgi:hypothetical protein
MSGKLLIGLAILAICVGSTACKRTSPFLGELGSAPTAYVDAIPLEYGRLVAVSTTGGSWDALWFEKADKTIIVVPVKWMEQRLGDSVTVIARR